MTKPLAVVVGFIGKLPMAGMTLYNTHYIAGLQELGYDVHYVERQNGPEDYYDPRRNAMTSDVAGGAMYAEIALIALGIGPMRLSLIDAAGNCRGSGWHALNNALDSADFVLDLADATWFDELARCPRRAFVDGDPLFTQASMLRGGQVAKNIDNYNCLFTYCTRIGEPDCSVPKAGREWIATRPVVCTRMWEPDFLLPADSRPLTNIMNWSAAADVVLGGRTYGQKGVELERFIDMPSMAHASFVLALGGPAPRQRLRDHGWVIIDPLAVSETIDTYREFIAGSRADFGIAKHAYVASRSGWFSDRSACYLASGRPVIHQDTGFTDWLPTGEGVFSFATTDQALSALEEIDTEYAVHAKAARRIAETHFEARTVIGNMLADAGLGR